jgi:hypothetical protein
MAFTGPYLQAVFMRHMTMFTVQSVRHNSHPPLAFLSITFAYFV